MNDLFVVHGALIQVHKAWSRYRKTLLTEAYQRGFPMMRHMYMQFPLDPQTPSIDSQVCQGQSYLSDLVFFSDFERILVFKSTGNGSVDDYEMIRCQLP